MSDFIGDHQCVTHHKACDCREAHFEKLEAENKAQAERIAELEKQEKRMRDALREQGFNLDPTQSGPDIRD